MGKINIIRFSGYRVENAAISFDETAQFSRDVLDDRVPGPECWLPEKPRSWIPRTVFAADQPFPVSHMGEHNPNRLTQSTSKMHNRRVGGDDKIKACNGSSRISEVVKVR